MKCLLPGLQQLLKPNTHGLSTYTDTFGTIKEVNDFCKACKNGFRQYTESMEQARHTIEDVQPTPKPPPVTVMSCPCKSRYQTCDIETLLIMPILAHSIAHQSPPIHRSSCISPLEGQTRQHQAICIMVLHIGQGKAYNSEKCGL